MPTEPAKTVAAAQSASVETRAAITALPGATRASAGGACEVREPVVVGSTASSPIRGAGVQLVASPHGTWVAWRDGPQHLAVQRVDDEFRPVGGASRVALARPRGTVRLSARPDALLVTTHASCNKRLQHCLGFRWLDPAGAPLGGEWEYETKRGDPVAVVQASLAGQEAVAYTYRYWPPLVVRVPAPGEPGEPGEPDVQDVVFPGKTIAHKLALVPTATREDVHVLASAQTDEAHGVWQLRWFARAGEEEGTVVTSGRRLLAPDLASQPPFAAATPSGTLVVGWADETAPWQLRLDGTGAVVDPSPPMDFADPPWFAPVRASLLFEGKKLWMRRRVWGEARPQDVLVAKRSWHRSGAGAASVAWMGQGFGVVVAERTRSGWAIVATQVRCGLAPDDRHRANQRG